MRKNEYRIYIEDEYGVVQFDYVETSKDRVIDKLLFILGLTRMDWDISVKRGDE